MSHFDPKLSRSSTLRRRFHHRVSLLQRCLLRVLHRILLCSGSKPTNATYSMLPPALPSPPPPMGSDGELGREEMDLTSSAVFHTHDLDSDLVSLKISLLGDCQIGKTSFLVGSSLFFNVYNLANMDIFLYFDSIGFNLEWVG